MTRTFNARALALLLLLGTALVLTKVWLAQRNTLANNGRWKSTKVGLARGVVGAVAFVATRPALSGDELDLSAWHGYQEVVYDQALELESVELAFTVQARGYLIVEYDRDNDGFSGVRLDGSPRRGPILFRADPAGRFLQRQELKPLDLRPGTNHLRLSFGRTTLVEINGREAARDATHPHQQQRLGLRGGAGPAKVDNVVFTLKDGTTLRESFHNTRGLAATFAVFFALLLFLAGAVSRLAATQAQLAIASTLVTAFVASALIYAADRYYFSARYRDEPNLLDNLLRRADMSGYRNSIESADDVLTRLRQTAPPQRAGSARVLFVGSSQTWGAGAADPDETFVELIAAQLAKDFAGRVDCVNAAISGWRSEQLWTQYRDEWLRLKPDVVVINLSNNDRDRDAFERYIELFVQENKRRGIQTILSLEANDAERPSVGLYERHEVMRRVASKHGIPLVDLHGEIERRNDEGLTWWDVVHFSSWGHRLAASVLYEPVRSALRKSTR